VTLLQIDMDILWVDIIGDYSRPGGKQEMAAAAPNIIFNFVH